MMDACKILSINPQAPVVKMLPPEQKTIVDLAAQIITAKTLNDAKKGYQIRTLQQG